MINLSTMKFHKQQVNCSVYKMSKIWKNQKWCLQIASIVQSTAQNPKVFTDWNDQSN